MTVQLHRLTVCSTSGDIISRGQHSSSIPHLVSRRWAAVHRTCWFGHFSHSCRHWSCDNHVLVTAVPFASLSDCHWSWLLGSHLPSNKKSWWQRWGGGCITTRRCWCCCTRACHQVIIWCTMPCALSVDILSCSRDLLGKISSKPTKLKLPCHCWMLACDLNSEPPAENGDYLSLASSSFDNLLSTSCWIMMNNEIWLAQKWRG